MAAVDQLLARLATIDEVVDFAQTSGGATPQVVLDHALRGVAVHGLAAFEQFVRERGAEWTAFLTSARVPASHLPGGPGSLSTRIVQTLPRRFRDLDAASRQTLVAALAQTLASFSATAVVGHDLFFAWSGSNIQASDVEAIVGLAGPAKAWAELTGVWSLIDPRFPGNASAESLFASFSTQRHTAAHDADAVLDPLAVTAITRNVKVSALILDLTVSICLKRACAGASITSGVSRALSIRHVRRDGKEWPEYSPGSSGRAYRRHASLPVALVQAGARANANDEVVIALDGNEIVDWRASI